MKTLNIFSKENYSSFESARLDGAVYSTKIPADTSIEAIEQILKVAGECFCNYMDHLGYTVGDNLESIIVQTSSSKMPVYGAGVASGYHAYSPDLDEDFMAIECVCLMPDGSRVSLFEVLEFCKVSNITTVLSSDDKGSPIHHFKTTTTLSTETFNDSLQALAAAYYLQ